MSADSRLRHRWDALWAKILREGGQLAPGPTPPPPQFDPIARAYSARGRHYHNLDHIAHCLAELDGAVAGGIAQDPVALELAVWFHDLVYDPARSDNEAESARAATRLMRGFAVPLDAVTRLIACTKHDRPPGEADADARLIVDVDLSILGQPAEVFDAYDRAIRLEYAHVPDEPFASGRAEVLSLFLDRPAIYATQHFRDRYERAARENLRRAVRRWSGG